MKHTMEVVWHSCTDCPPIESYNAKLFITDGKDVFPASWKKECGRYVFVSRAWYIEPGVNSDGYWWADLIQTVGGNDW